MDSENRALTSRLEELKNRRDSATGKEKGNTETEMVQVKDQWDKNEYQKKLNEKKMKKMVNAAVEIDEKNP